VQRSTSNAILDRVRFDADGLVPAIAQDAATGQVLMLAYMNAEALRQTLATGEMVYYSRSRQALWRKGATSGHTQRVVEARLDCDADALVFRVEQTGGACHTGHRSCFYRRITNVGHDTDGDLVEDGETVFDPDAVYGSR
jgi:phosphoribosyl-AMP cyclohydrolase